MIQPGDLWHGGMPGLWRGDRLLPDMAAVRFVPGCKECEAHAQGLSISDPCTPAGFVYATSDREYARHFASRAGRGTLYRVKLLGNIEAAPSEDLFPTWKAPSAIVVAVVEQRITLTWKQRRKLFIRWGGTDAEFEAMVQSTLANVRP